MNGLSPKSATTFRRRGTVVVLTAVVMVTLLCFASLAVDVGYICALTTEQQNTADAAALGGTTALRYGNGGDAIRRARRIIGLNQIPQGYRSPRDQTIELGDWDCLSDGYTAIDPAFPNKANAVRVVARRNNVSLFFAGIMGINKTNVSREAIAMVRKPCLGIWGIGGVKVPGNVYIDSYDSTVGNYSPGTANEDGDVCSNGDIKVAGSAEVHGDVMPGPGAELIVNGSATISGHNCAHAGITAVDFPPVDLTDVLLNNDNALIGLTDLGNNPFSSAWNVSISGGDGLTLAPGTYYFDSMSFSGPATLTITGPTTIYLGGDFDATGEAIVNTTQNPGDFTILSAGSEVKLTGQAAFYGFVYAPNATVTLSGTADYFGEMIGGTLKITGNFQFHLDESLIPNLLPVAAPSLVR